MWWLSTKQNFSTKIINSPITFRKRWNSTNTDIEAFEICSEFFENCFVFLEKYDIHIRWKTIHIFFDQMNKIWNNLFRYEKIISYFIHLLKQRTFAWHFKDNDVLLCSNCHSRKCLFDPEKVLKGLWECPWKERNEFLEERNSWKGRNKFSKAKVKFRPGADSKN